MSLPLNRFMQLFLINYRIGEKFLSIYILLFAIVAVCLLFYWSYRSISIKRKKQTDPLPVFKVDVSNNNVVDDYVKRMPQQYKDNSRLLEGSGKMHFVKTVSEGSNIVREQTFSVLSSIGDRFS